MNLYKYIIYPFFQVLKTPSCAACAKTGFCVILHFSRSESGQALHKHTADAAL